MFIFVKQLQHSEKKIRCLSLLQQLRCLVNNDSTVRTGQCVFKMILIWKRTAIGWRKFFSNVALENISQADAALCYCVSSYSARRIDNQRKCTSCKELLISSNTTLEVTERLPEEHQNLFEMANRGGLVKPSAFCFVITVLAMQFFIALASNAENMNKLLTLNIPRGAFANAFPAVANASISCNLIAIKCNSDHTNFKFIVRTVFNCFAKNHLKKLNSRPATENPQKKFLKKIRKLTSKMFN